jgi:predicted nucleic acid-binding protein
MPNRRPVISDTTPLITLAGAGLLNLLQQLYDTIWIPEAVYSEYQLGRIKHPNHPDLNTLPWISVHPATLEDTGTRNLDLGETETIALARYHSARLVLLDERSGRREAVRLGLPVAGTLAVLLQAKEQGLISAIRPIIDQFQAQGRRISPALRSDVLALAGEATDE